MTVTTSPDLIRVLGLMSGTSMDGVDVALIDTDGESQITQGPHGFFPYTTADRAVLRQALTDAAGMEDRTARPGSLARAEALVTARHAEAIEHFLVDEKIPPRSVDLVGFHGQTVLHRPADRLTVQIGEGDALATRLGIAVAWDFRANDVDAGGQGAPLVPVYHQALVEQAGLDGPVALVNIGGVANLTFVTRGQNPIACDTGPGNALLDDLLLDRLGEPYDHNGVISAAGQVDDHILAALLDHPFFALPAPKSLDRNAFSNALVAGLKIENAAATLAAFTAASVSRAIESMPRMPSRVIVCGGGGYNPTIMRELARRIPCEVVLAGDLGWSVDAMEAQAFGYLAVRCAKDLPITFPGTTGGVTALTGGRISQPRE